MPLLSFSVIKHNIEACDPKLQPGMSGWQEGTESLKFTQVSVSVAFCSLGQGDTLCLSFCIEADLSLRWGKKKSV